MSIKKVVTWVNEPRKALWWRQAIRTALRNGELSDIDLEELYKLAQMEVGAIDKDANYVLNTAPVILVGFDVEESPVCLLNINNVKNVSTLVEDQTLSFDHSGLTVIYGDNGSGKSSYSKILKNACLTRGDTPKIIQNIYDSKLGTASASLKIQVGTDAPIEVNWTNGNPVNEDLKSIRVFDSYSSNHYITKEDAIEYKPASLKILDELIRACEYIKSKVVKERKPTTRSQFPICKPDTQAQEFLTKLDSKTTEAQLKVVCLSQEEIDSIEILQKELLVLQTTTPEKLKENFRNQYQNLEPLHSHFIRLKTVLSDDAVENMRLAYDDFQTKKVAAELARKTAIDGHAVKNICSEAWQNMWRHVETFIKSNGQGLSFPPAQGEHCPTCLQIITEDTAKTLISFNNYLQDQTQIEANKAKRVFEQYQKSISVLLFDLTPYKGVLENIKAFKPEVEDKIRQLNIILEKRAKNALLDKPILAESIIDYASMNWVSLQIDNLKVKEKEINDDASLKETINKEQVRIKELQERYKITLANKMILNAIDNLKINHLLNQVHDMCAYGSVTNLVTSISRDGSIGKLNAVFNQEIKELGFKGFYVETGTRGAKGQQMLKLKLSGKNNKISDIASEGEQKCISLAGFLAELTVDERKSAIIFDDPINSLDHHWRRKFSDRIAKESKKRQVILLTHDLAFLKMLDESIIKAESAIKIVAVRKHGKLAGYPMNTPPWGIMKTTTRIGELKNMLPQLKKLLNNPDPTLYDEKACIIYNKKRETWERLVEEILLKGIVERFGRDVKTQNIKYIANDITDNDVKTIYDAMDKCSTFMIGHDRARELGIDFPDYEEIEADIQALDVYCKALNKRRN